MTVARSAPRWPMPAALAALLIACAGAVPPPDWQLDAKASLDRATAAYLAGDTRLEALEFEQAHREIASTGRLDLLARAELIRCATHVASLVFEPCAGFEQLRAEAGPADRAYADYLYAQVLANDIGRLPAAQRAIAGADHDPPADDRLLKGIDGPLSTLVAAAVLFKTGRASPPVIERAVQAAGSEGWRRPLLAWLHVQLALAERAADTDAAERLRRRIGVVQQSEP